MIRPRYNPTQELYFFKLFLYLFENRWRCEEHCRGLGMVPQEDSISILGKPHEKEVERRYGTKPCIRSV